MNPTRIVIKVAQRSIQPYRHGAIIVKGKRLLSEGVNRDRTHPKSNQPTLLTHAEFDAIQKAGDDIRGAILYVTRVLADGTLAMSKPCVLCQDLINRCGLSEVVYTDRGGKFVSMSAPSSIG